MDSWLFPYSGGIMHYPPHRCFPDDQPIALPKPSLVPVEVRDPESRWTSDGLLAPVHTR
ncbi:hypothetical protein BD309DRAFT_878597 [Dichomitus squalens]|nr:hypothetical protein BD309DRAFT_878597 [Dichomitus squalens]